MSKSVGAISYNSQDVIGTGATSIVYRGSLGERPVAVKRVEKKLARVVRSEISQLQISDAHKNIIRYFVTEEDADYFYIALELCLYTLKDYATDSLLRNRIAKKKVIEDMIDGMRWIHKMNVVHRDIKPTNVLLFENAIKELELKISDFGISKQMEISDSQMSVVPDGSSYWSVPEMARGRYNFKSDVYSMGCLIYYIIKNGNFSKTNDLIDFDWSSDFENSCDGVLLKHLVKAMTKPNPEERPTFECLQFGPYFWPTQKVLSFILAVADRVKIGDYQANEAKGSIQLGSENVFDTNWETRLEPEVINSLAYRSQRHTYGTSSISELLRAIRNKQAHYDEISSNAKQIYGPIPNGFASYWTEKFPKLLLHIYDKIGSTSLRSDETLAQYYPPGNVCNHL